MYLGQTPRQSSCPCHNTKCFQPPTFSGLRARHILTNQPWRKRAAPEPGPGAVWRGKSWRGLPTPPKTIARRPLMKVSPSGQPSKKRSPLRPYKASSCFVLQWYAGSVQALRSKLVGAVGNGGSRSCFSRQMGSSQKWGTFAFPETTNTKDI